MRWKLLDKGPPATHAVVLGSGDEAVAVLGRSDGSVVGGHLLEGYVRPTLEVVFVEPPAHLKKRKDPETGLALIALDKF